MSVLRTTLTQALAGAALVTAALGATASTAVADSVLLHDPATDSAAGADIQSVRVTTARTCGSPSTTRTSSRPGGATPAASCTSTPIPTAAARSWR